MADEADVANDYLEKKSAKVLADIREQAAYIPVGEFGKCAECGYYFDRIVSGYCGRCRDLLRK
jgi:hypothetical protein